jgi:hypothetical protein
VSLAVFFAARLAGRAAPGIEENAASWYICMNTFLRFIKYPNEPSGSGPSAKFKCRCPRKRVV